MIEMFYFMGRAIDMLLSIHELDSLNVGIKGHYLSPAWKGLTSWLSFVVSTVSLSLSHWYPGSGVVLDCVDS